MENKEMTSAQKIDELVETGKQKGYLTYKEIMDQLSEFNLNQLEMDRIYERLETANVDVVEEEM